MKITPDDIDAILPQTQCGLCNYGACMPYAEALAYENAPIDLCPPGGVKGLIKIAALLEKDPNPFIAEMEKKTKPKLLAVIRENECIGCTKCIQACPVDAILGASKQMHSIINQDCTGCELCVAPCPVDCIDMLVVNEESETETRKQADRSRTHYKARQKRLAEETNAPKKIFNKKDLIQSALLRAQKKCSPDGTSGV